MFLLPYVYTKLIDDKNAVSCENIAHETLQPWKGTCNWELLCTQLPTIVLVGFHSSYNKCALNYLKMGKVHPTIYEQGKG